MKESIASSLYSIPFDKLHKSITINKNQIETDENSKIDVIKHTKSAYGEYLTVGFNSKIIKDDRIYIYQKRNAKYHLYTPVALPLSIGLKQGFDKKLERPDIPHLGLVNSLMPPDANEVGVVVKRKDHYVKLKSIKH